MNLRSFQKKGIPSPPWNSPFAWILVFVAILPWATPCFGATRIAGLYEAEVPVEGQDAAQRNQAIVEAFRRTLVKVTGNRRVGERDDLQKAIRGASRYVQQYRYRLIPVEKAVDTGSDSATSSPDPSEKKPEARVLRVRFDSQAVNRMLRSHGLPVWGTARPAVLLWLGIEGGSGRAFYFPERDLKLGSAIEETAEERGLQLMLPLMDLEDQSALTISDLWGAFVPNILAASERYVPDVVVTGRIDRAGRRDWEGRWSMLRTDGRTLDWKSEGRTKEEVVALGIHGAMDILATQYAPILADGELTDLRIRVSGVDNLERYARVTSYLKSLDMVENVVLDVVEPGVTGFGLKVRGGSPVLERGIALGNVLEQEAVDTPMPIQPGAKDSNATVSPLTPTLHFRLRQ